VNLFSQVPKKCTDLDLSFLYILILRTYSEFTRKNNFLALGVCFLQPCSSTGRRFATSRSRLQYYRRIVSFPQQKNRWYALWTGFHWESAFIRVIPNPTLSDQSCQIFYKQGYYITVSSNRNNHQSMGSKDAPQKVQFLSARKKVASLGAFIKNAKVAENPIRFGRHRSKIGPNPNVLAYSRTPWIGSNMHIWVYE